MTLAVGTRLGPYEVVAPLGAGGMGEVYRAEDTRLGRSVAIKVQAAELASQFGARERFEREAKAISALTHPNICALFDVGHQDGTDYLVMELVEGVTAGRAAGGRPPVLRRSGPDRRTGCRRARDRPPTGHRSVVNSGEEAITRSKAEKPDLILMDVVMPGMSGFEATRAITRDAVTANIPVIMCTSKGQETDRVWGMRQGAKDYIVKPVQPDELIARDQAVRLKADPPRPWPRKKR